MARRRKMTPERREFINGLLEHYQPTDAQDVQEMLKDLLGDREFQSSIKKSDEIKNHLSDR